MLGFDKVFDTDFTADLTIIEEGHELLHRMKTGGVLPMLTSCSPGWINFIEQYYPELLPHVSSCKSPQQMFGALAKAYYPRKIGKRAEDIFSVSIMPCTAKKFEALRDEMSIDGKEPDVDVVLTTRELGKMLKQAGIDFVNLPEEKYDDPFGITTGAAVIFGATGGVMEAALRTVYEVVTGKTLEALDFKDVRGLAGIKESEVDLGGTKVKVAVAHSLSKAREVLELIKAGKADYAFVEIMCCPGGCIGGGGQPYGATDELRQKRMDAIYRADRDLPLRKSHESPAVKQIYKDFLGEPLGEKSHHLLHTTYKDRSKKVKV
jgi:NADH-quinone oxidoreductase subunit G/NADP-reducing hydrogenase subunit HndD